MTALSINLNKIALLRNAREGSYPDPVVFGRLCIEAGCQGITVHPRPDQRHVRPDDVKRIATLTAEYEHIEYNIEGNPFAEARGDYPGFATLVIANQPDQVTLVPDEDSQLTSDHGFDLNVSGEALAPLIKRFQSSQIRVSLFMDADPDQIHLAQEIGADRIELYTGPYAQAFLTKDPEFPELHKTFLESAALAQTLGLGVNAGHDLNLSNLKKFVEIPGILEVSIGHAFTVDSLLNGLESTVSSYLGILNRSS